MKVISTLLILLVASFPTLAANGFELSGLCKVIQNPLDHKITMYLDNGDTQDISSGENVTLSNVTIIKLKVGGTDDYPIQKVKCSDSGTGGKFIKDGKDLAIKLIGRSSKVVYRPL